MAAWIAHDIMTTMLRKNIATGSARILVLGCTFKENVSDVRNSKAIDLIREIEQVVAEVIVYDPVADPAVVMEEYGLTIFNQLPNDEFDGVVVAVSHDEIVCLGIERIRAVLLRTSPTFVYDVKGVLPAADADGGIC